MTNITKFVSMLAVLAAGSSVFAQTQPENPAVQTTAGLLGQRYVDAGAGLINQNHSSIDLYAVGSTVNLPVASNLDVAVNYSYTWVESHSDVDYHDLSVDGIYFVDAAEGLKLFGGLSVGYNWNDFDDEAYWGIFAGTEYVITSKIVLTARGGYEATFDESDEGTWQADVSGRYYFTDKLAGTVGVTWLDGGSIGYTAGVTLKF